MEAFEVVDQNKILARYIPNKAAWKEGLNFFSNEDEFQQVGTWSYDKEKYLKAHKHNILERKINITQEVIFVRKGSLKAKIYNHENVLCKVIKVFSGDILILFSGGHGYEILEDKTEVLEIKNGPYFGAEKDRSRIE